MARIIAELELEERKTIYNQAREELLILADIWEWSGTALNVGIAVLRAGIVNVKVPTIIRELQGKNRQEQLKDWLAAFCKEQNLQNPLDLLEE